MFNLKNIKIGREDLLLLFVIVFFILFSIIIPLYDNVNGFHNLIFDDYKLIWYDGRSPANFYITKNLLENKSISFPKCYVIGDIPVENLFDFIQKDGNFFPLFNFLGNYIYAGILCLIPFPSELSLFKAMILINIAFNAILLLIFYHVQRLLGLKIKFALLSTLVAGIATSVLIYSRYLFIEHTFLNLFLISLIYVLLKFRKKTSLKIEMLACIIFSLFLIFLWNVALVLIFFAVFSYFFIKYKFLRFTKTLIISLLAVCIMIVFIELLYTNENIYRDYPSGIKEIVEIGFMPIFRVFPSYIPALDYSIYGYHNQTSVWKLSRQFGLIYAFEETKGNAIFLSGYSIFASLFGARGFVFNSPFLIFSILGIFIYKRKRERNLLLIIIILTILTYGLYNLRGTSPRYGRYFNIPILFLTFFTFYFIQETKSVLTKLIFIVLVILSLLNVSSLAIRADWAYEHESDLVSYDLVLWSWVEPPYLYLNWYPPETINGVVHRHMPEEAKYIFYSESSQVANFSFSVKSFYKERTMDVIVNDKLVGTYKIPTNVVKITNKVKIQEGKNTVIFRSREGCDIPSKLGVNPDIRCISFTFHELNFTGS